MLIIFWLICVLTFLLLASLLLIILLKNPDNREYLRTFFNGLSEGFFKSGLKNPKARYPIELWIWETLDDEDVCEDCLDRTTWPPMDIADWMKEGLPGTPESETQCHDNCRCQLVRYNPRKSSQHYHKK